MRPQVFLLFMLWTQGICGREVLKVGFLGMGPEVRAGPPSKLSRAGSAMLIALDDIANNTDILPDHTVSYVIKYTECSEKLGLRAIYELQIEGGIDGIVGPACSTSGRGVGMLGSLWNVPVIAYSGSSADLSDKRVFDTYSRMVAPLSETGRVFRNVFKQFGWSRGCMVMTAVVGHLTYIRDGVTTYLQADNVTLSDTSYFDDRYPATDERRYLQALRSARQTCRIVILLAYMSEILEVIPVATDLGFFDNDEFALVVYTDIGTVQVLDFSWMWTSNAAQNRKLSTGYASSLFVTKIPVSVDPNYWSFLEEVRERLLGPPFYSNLSSTSRVSGAAGYLYDAMMLYALTADSMIRQGLDPRDGRAFSKHVQTISFRGKTGSVSVNENGDRNDDFAIWAVPNKSFHRVATYDGFRQAYVSIHQVTWGSGSVTPPLDSPVCGFSGELCPEQTQSDTTLIILGLTFVVVVIGLVAVGVVLYRRKQFETELQAANWIIAFADINFANQKVTSTFSLASGHFSLRSEVRNPQVALYKNEKVFVKDVQKASIDWKKRSLLLELKMARDIRHDHLVNVVGACVEPGHICILTRYCSKGALDDVLENNDIQLDLMFKGLQYLHKSEINCHGNLKSTNCLVDNRWSIKLSGFGLHEFRRPDIRLDKGDMGEAIYKKILWTAPEHLRAPGTISQRGDIYSLGIVLQEVAQRTAPFASAGDLEPQEIVDKIRTPSGEPFRPEVPKDACPETLRKLMVRCWAEDPYQRPGLGVVTKDLRQLNNGREINIMDNMVSMLEKYASNLEEIVADRTLELTEEKKKTDMLLNQMLPSTVADKLKMGLTVDPESYDHVTIFFSDIVGFTSLSAESTPFQVVMLLNDLYTLFDSILETYDVYKVETIGDAYMVVSGLPVRNGRQHAAEVATVSLHLLSSVLTFRIRHFPDRKLKLRIGIHTGSCVAGVVGLKMPRYCLFGDTVNTASRMESNGQALRVHLSGQTKDVLDGIGGFTISERGRIEMKGKGAQTTYWLLGKEGFQMALPEWTSD